MLILLFGDRSRKVVAAAQEEIRAGLAAAGAEARIADLRAGPVEAARAALGVVFGGDGAILAAARALGEAPLPLVGVNMGRLGFLTEFDLEGLRRDLDRLAAGDFTVEERMRLAIRVERDGRAAFEGIAVNEGIVASRDIARIMQIRLWIDERRIADVWGDGLIAATPAGSTGHSLSAGGPIVEHGAEAIVVTPICSHTLSVRPLVLAAGRRVAFRIESGPPEPVLTMDGQSRADLAVGDTVRVARAPRPLRLASFGRRGFFGALADTFQKGWGRQRRPDAS